MSIRQTRNSKTKTVAQSDLLAGPAASWVSGGGLIINRQLQVSAGSGSQKLLLRKLKGSLERPRLRRYGRIGKKARTDNDSR